MGTRTTAPGRLAKLDLLSRLNPRVIDFHSCAEWRHEAPRLGVPKEPGPDPRVTAKLEALSRPAAQRLSRLVARAGGQSWLGAGTPNGCALVVRAQPSVFECLATDDGREPKPVKQATACLRDALAGYGRERFVFKLRSGSLRFGRRALVMGILNVTPDSFSDGGAFVSRKRAVEHGAAMCDAGADVIDVGGESTRPGAEAVSEHEEKRRVLPVIEALSARIDAAVSIDTSKASVARDALAAGAQIINDVSGLRGDPELAAVAAEFGAPLIVMHMLGDPRVMQARPRYRDVMADVARALRESVRTAVAAGVAEGQVAVDPGIGFGKTVKHNLEIMRRLHEFRSLGRPVLVGSSRKSFIGKTLGAPVERRVFGTAATVAWAVAQGASIVRVHDVAEAVDVVRMTEAMASRQE